ncbi:MAG TPA: insulinase family protein [Ruminococcaceae bacterium]|nr:insulinase family protein [Oscillospiraceae bacterium]
MRTEIYNELLDEKYYHIAHPTGLNIYVMPKVGYSGAYAVFGTNYGSIDTKIRNENGESVDIPEGTAHFLEHKLFESEDLDAFERYAKTGASANAFTSFDSTCYLFSCTGDFNASLRILLDFVQSPYFTEQTVSKEQGIIGQEITMYKDVADWEVLFNLLRALYHKHPVRIDIAGTVQSISEITAQTLYDCYRNFYNLNNMALAISGNVDIDEIEKICDELLKPSEPFLFERKPADEPDEICCDYIEEKLSVAAPIFSLGFKESYGLPKQNLKQKVATDILMEVLAGTTSPLYNELLEKGLTNTSFGFESFFGFGYGASIFSGESKDPKAAAELIQARIAQAKETGISEEEFETVRRKLYGRLIMSYNDVDDIANTFVGAHFDGEDIFDPLEVFRTIRLADINKALQHMMRDGYAALSVINPIE